MGRDSNRARRRRRPKARRITPLHWMNLLLYCFVLVVLLLGIRALGHGTASCVMDAAGPVDESPLEEQSPMDDADAHGQNTQ